MTDPTAGSTQPPSTGDWAPFGAEWEEPDGTAIPPTADHAHFAMWDHVQHIWVQLPENTGSAIIEMLVREANT